jgi:carboxymethylenebutenolidase
MHLINIETNDGPMPTASALPEGEAKAAVIVIQEAFGLTDHITGLTDRLAIAGFRSIAPALFHRVNSKPFAYDDMASIRPLMESLSAETLTTDLDAALGQLAGEGFAESAIGMVGFCMGGSVSLYAATRPGLGAAVTFYGGGLSIGRFGLPPLIEIAPSLRCPWMGLFGDLDASIPVEEVEQLRAAAASSGQPTEIVRYAEAGHGFNCNDRPVHYQAEAAADGWAKMLEFFGEKLRTESAA